MSGVRDVGADGFFAESLVAGRDEVTLGVEGAVFAPTAVSTCECSANVSTVAAVSPGFSVFTAHASTTHTTSGVNLMLLPLSGNK
jgi:hypothetical protein